MRSIIFISVVIAVASAVSHHKQQNNFKSNYGGKPTTLVNNPHDQELEIHPNGEYSYRYDTHEGISASESGVGGKHVQGHVRYVDNEGTPVELTYVADENGYQPSGSHLPTPPPVPQQIARALEYIRTHPQIDAVPYNRVH